MVWGLGVGYVISGNYFGWNLGLEKGGTLGMAMALFFVIILYITFTFSYTELACAIPKSGGAFDYAKRALGDGPGFIAGMAQNIEFIFAPPAIAFAIGAYFNIFFSGVPVVVIAILAYLVFFSLNVAGVRIAAVFELAVTTLAVAAVFLFCGISFQHFEFDHLKLNALPFGWPGAFAAVPFAIWFFLGIEGVANLAEEAINPKRTIMLGFGSAIFTLVILCLLTFTGSIGIAGWEAIVFRPDGSTSDSPLPLAMGHVVGNNNWQYHVLITFGLFGLVASFHGLMLAAGRSTMEFGRANYGPAFLGKIHPRFQTPANALFANMVIGILALLTAAAIVLQQCDRGSHPLCDVADFTVRRRVTADFPQHRQIACYDLTSASQRLELFAAIRDMMAGRVDHRCAIFIHARMSRIGCVHRPWDTRKKNGSHKKSSYRKAMK